MVIFRIREILILYLPYIKKKECLKVQILIGSILAWFIAQVIKVIRMTIKKKKLDTYSLVASGGMPSSHTALVVALTTGVGINSGVDSIYFAICAVFSMIIMYDAAGVRRAVGIQARKINQLLDDFGEGKEFDNKKLVEILGHTPMEVIGGIVLGIAVGTVVSLF